MSSRRIGLAYGASLLGVFTSLLNNLWLMRLVALGVDRADFGIYLFTASLMAYFGLSQMGLDLASAQRIAEALTRDDRATANRIYHQLTWFNRTLCSVLAAAVAATVFLVMFSGSVEQPKLVASIVALVGAGMGLKLLSNPATAVLAGSQNVHLVSGLNLANSLFSTLFAYVFLRSGAGILCLPAAQTIVSLLTLVALHGLRRRVCSWSREPVVDLWNRFGDLLRFALNVAACVMLGMIDASSEPIIFQFASETPLIDIGTYNIWYRFPALTLVVASSLLGSAGPSLASRMEKSRREGLALHRNLLWLSGGIGGCAIVGLCIWLVPFIHHWLSGTYDIDRASWTAIGMAAAIGFRVLMNALAVVFYPLDRVRVVISGYAVLAVTKIVVGVSLVRLMSPIEGMAWANMIAATASSLYFAYMLQRVADYSTRTLTGVFAFVAFAIFLGISLSGLTLRSSMASMVVGIGATMLGLGAFYIALIRQLGFFSWRRFLAAKP